MTNSNVDDTAEILGIFIQESREHLEDIEPILLELEENGSDPDPAMLNKIFRAVHSIKGSAGFFGLKNITHLSHIMESLMAKVRDGSIAVGPYVIDALLKGLDKLKLMIDDVTASESADCSDEVDVLEGIMSGKLAETKGNGQKSEAASPKTPESPEKSDGSCDISDKYGLKKAVYEKMKKESSSTGYKLYDIILQLPNGPKKRRNLINQVNELTSTLGSTIAMTPDIGGKKSLTQLCNKKGASAVSFLFSTILDLDLISGTLPAQGVDIIEVELEEDKAESVAEIDGTDSVLPVCPAVSEGAAVSAEAASKRIAPKMSSSSESVRIRVELLDKILTLAGEIVLGRNQLMRQYEGLKNNTNLIAHSQRVTELQESVMKTRLQPVGTVFTKFKRIVRDMAKMVSKEINLTLEGEDVELDRSIIEALSDPITHLIRNAVDHALEGPDEREDLGKARAGSISLRAFHEGGQIVIELEDDGRGIDAARIKAKAIEKGVVTEEEAERMRNKELINLIFSPGFSTAEQVSQISGRGVGMDVVKTSFEKLGGSVEIHTTLGAGTLITVRLPLTLAIVPSLIVSAANYSYAVPQVDVVEIVRIVQGDSRHRIEMIEGQDVFRLRDKLLPVVRLADALGIENRSGVQKEGTVETDSKVAKKSIGNAGKIKRLIVLRSGANKVGLLVDDVFDPEEIVVKPLPSLVKSCTTFSGATILGDGQVTMILNISGIVAKTGLKFDSFKKVNVDTGTDTDLNAHESTMLIFKNSSKENFAIPLSAIRRIEKTSTEQIERMSGREFAQLRGGDVELLYLEEHLNVTPVERLEGQFFVIFPKLTGCSSGIVASEIVDVVETIGRIDTESVKGTGILGSSVILDKMTLIIDVDTLIEKVPQGIDGTTAEMAV